MQSEDLKMRSEDRFYRRTYDACEAMVLNYVKKFEANIDADDKYRICQMIDAGLMSIERGAFLMGMSPARMKKTYERLKKRNEL